MGHPDIDYQLLQEKHREDIAAAERWRLAKQAQAAAKANSPSTASANQDLAWSFRLRQSIYRVLITLARALSLVGSELLNWGCRLQTHYQMLSTPEIQRRPKPCA